MSAADGYARITGKPQGVIVHVDAGTAALGQGLHNASSGRAPMLVFAGLAPYTIDGELPGSRSEHVQWYQDVPNQASIVAPYAPYSNEIKAANHVRLMVKRALLMASTNLEKLLGVPDYDESNDLVATKGGTVLDFSGKVVGVISSRRKMVELF